LLQKIPKRITRLIIITCSGSKESGQMRIAKLCEKKRLSQLQLVRLIGTSQQAISRLEIGEYERFTLKILEKTAEVTGMRVEIKFVMA
jgi:transcriptional regulator with XRE-family HTH domain